ncbi:MAG: sugar ABC transporter permease [Chloroflexi bacterium]|nr:sugar ABC transporter permease [Chloroflexota bacterium]
MKVSKWFIVLCLLPAGLLYLTFFLIPAGQTFRYSFYDWSGLGKEMEFVGIDNFTELVKDDLFISSMKNTVSIVLLGGAIVFGLALLFTMMLNSGVRGKKFFRAIIFLPNVVATIALTTMWANIYNPRFGMLNRILGIMGFEDLTRTTWLAPDKIFWSMLVALIWIYVGFYLVLLMAGVDRIPVDYYEAAKLDGASQLQTFFSITIPLLWDVLTVAIVYWTIAALKIFEFPFAFTGVQPVPQTYTVAVYLYIMGFGQRMPIYRLGYASAMGVLLLLAVLATTFIIGRLMRRESIEF